MHFNTGHVTTNLSDKRSIWELLGAPSVFAGASSNSGERAKMPFTLSYKNK